MIKRSQLMLAAVLGAFVSTTLAADSYVLGLTGDLTGRDAANSGAVADGIRIYFERVNRTGGINGHKVEVLVRDNQSEPSRAATDAQTFVNNEDLLLMITASLSSTYAPTISESKRKGVPVLFAGGVCPREVFPPKPDPLLFCTSGYAAETDVKFAVDYIQSVQKNATLGLISMAIPISRGSIDQAAEYAKSKGMKVIGHESAPPPTANYTPYATKLKEGGADWVLSWAPWVTQVKTFEALRQLGWKGNFISYGHNVAEEELKRIKDPGFLVFTTNGMFSDGQPVHKDVLATAEGKTKFPITYLNEGWVAAMTLEAALKKAGWPVNRAKLASAMDGLSVDLRGLRGGPITWTKTNHYREQLYYRVYGWDAAGNRIKTLKDWTSREVK
ncbi:MAG: ABC transporter substrate-binding protein [Betaproteobacteria bacterium]|nr:MAG: ABC transporter substrate-binding protein [Betaproteobacteria bacterium]